MIFGLTLPTIVQSIFYLLAVGLTGVVLFMAHKYILPWVQKWQDKKTLEDVTDARKRVSDENTKHNQESDNLKDIDGR